MYDFQLQLISTNASDYDSTSAEVKPARGAALLSQLTCVSILHNVIASGCFILPSQQIFNKKRVIFSLLIKYFCKLGEIALLAREIPKL